MGKMKEIATEAMECGMNGMSSSDTFAHLKAHFGKSFEGADACALFDFWLEGRAEWEVENEVCQINENTVI